MANENYLPIVNALEVLMKRALEIKIKKEDPNGYIKTFKLSDIRIAYMSSSCYRQPYLNAIPGRQEVYKYPPEILITLFYKGKKKSVNCSISLKNGYLSTYEGILTAGWPRLAESIDDLLDTFYETSLEDVKYHLEYDPKHPPRMDDSEFTLPELEKIPKKFDEEFQALLRDYFVSKPIIELDATATSNRKVWIVVDSKGTRIIQKQDLMRFTIDPYALSPKKRVYTDGVYRMAFTFDELINEFPSAKKDLQQFLYTLDRKQLPSNIYPLIFDHSAVATLFHEAIAGHMLSGYYIVDEVSTIFKGKLNKSVARDNSMSILKKLQIWDCPLDEKMLAHYVYDMEGVPAKDVLLIDHGIVKNFLHDRYSAGRMKKIGNGHALSEDFQEKTLYNFMLRDSPRLPEPRVSNLKVVSNSKLTFKDLENYYFKKFGYYIFVKSFAGEVEVSTGTFKLKVDCLTKVYADGRKEYFHGGVFSSNLTDFISAVKEVSNDYGFAAGFCGSSSGSVPTHEYTPIMSVHGVNWAPYPLPDKSKKWNTERDKYVPGNWTIGDKYEVWFSSFQLGELVSNSSFFWFLVEIDISNLYIIFAIGCVITPRIKLHLIFALIFVEITRVSFF